ncbi:hypothetical protein [Microbulbifer sp.]|uniref:hypothetical protein n=1 Tax=Microbulbifer sp. TaxID=1908541 RepID=UPI002582B99C|nr:hypothetical protein [Microbulbifer sp.]
MKMFLSFLAFPLLCFSTAMPAFSGVELKLSDDRLLDVDLAEARLVGEFQGYAIIAGRSCVDCDENTAIYFEKIAGLGAGEKKRVSAEGEPREVPEPERFGAPDADDNSAMSSAGESDRPQADTDGVVEVDLSGERFSHPGQYRDYLTKELVEKTRMFYGNCYEGTPSVLWLTEYLTEEGWEKEEFLVVFREDGVEHRFNESRQPSMIFIDNENCNEVEGIALTTEP